MQTPILVSTALLTALLAVGLFFFIRASAKDRTEVTKLIAEQQGEPLLEQLQQYFTQRAYRIAAVDAAQNRVTFEGLVRPSAFLAVFLTFLAAIGILCLALVLSFAFPNAAGLPMLVLLAPLAGIFYWRSARRPEQVSLQVEALSDADTPPRSLLVVTAHRDELAEMQRSLSLKPFEVEAVQNDA
ncbi:MAG: cofactor assembly of complex C subunit B [Cyanobacteria bacterium CRU_2_1]|nr:cofactor assembly of complex C subunit B [Cyanobacteria bacterium CRU_2_1]